MEEYKKLNPALKDPERLRDRIRAAVYGYAIGDALGKGTEFMTVSEVAKRYPGGLKEYSQIIRDAHRSQWKRNEWTLDTENILRTIGCLIQDGGVDFPSQALKIKEYYATALTDATPIVRRVASERDFVVHPHAAARRVWKSVDEASNEALGAALFAALLPTSEPEKVASDIAGMTHADTRCLASAAVIGRMGHSLLWDGEEASRETIEEIADRIDSRLDPYVRMAYEDELSSYALDDEDTLWYTRKAMLCGLWAIIRGKSGEDALSEIIAQGGDADTNAALALALIGLRDGWKAIPKDLAETISKRDVLDRAADEYADFLLKEAGIEK